jgi:hypothetical protein
MAGCPRAYKAIDYARTASSPETPNLLTDAPIAIEVARAACGRAIFALGGQVPESVDEELRQALDDFDRETLSFFNDESETEEALRLLREECDKLQRGTPIQEVSRSVHARLPADTPPKTVTAINELIPLLAPRSVLRRTDERRRIPASRGPHTFTPASAHADHPASATTFLSTRSAGTNGAGGAVMTTPILVNSIGNLGRPVAVGVKRLTPARQGTPRPAEDGPDRMETEFEDGHDGEVPTAAAQIPQEFGLLGTARSDFAQPIDV